MSFHFVDRIYQIEPRVSIRGLKNVTRNENFFYWLPNGDRVISPAVITEALCQLGGWLKMVSTDFQKRAVLLADEKTEYLGLVRAGDQVDLEVDVLDFDDDVVVTRGKAFVNGQVVVDAHCCRGYLLPIEEFDDPVKLRRQYSLLYKPEFASVSRVGATARQLPALAGARTFDSNRFVDGIVEHIPFKKVVAYKNVAACESYFSTHFPNMPCVPGVLLLSFMGEACQFLVKPDIDMPIRQRALVPTFIENVRFRKFVEPGDQCTLHAEIIEGDPSVANSDIVVRVIIMANDNRALMARMGFRTIFADVEWQTDIPGLMRKSQLGVGDVLKNN